LISFRHFSYEFALVAILCTVALFLFPAAHGSFSAVHGPVTTLRSIKVKLRIWVALALAAAYLVGFHLPCFSSAWSVLEQRVLLFRSAPFGDMSVLRC
jgi:hypothetical protein